MTTTVTVYIKEQDIVNLIMVEKISLSDLSESAGQEILKQYPFTIYRERVVGYHIITIQIPIVDYCLYLGSGLVK